MKKRIYIAFKLVGWTLLLSGSVLLYWITAEAEINKGGPLRSTIDIQGIDFPLVWVILLGVNLIILGIFIGWGSHAIPKQHQEE